jgi:hypothetical protein
MSQENVEIVRGALEASSRGDAGILFRLADPDCRVYPRPAEPDAAAEYSGVGWPDGLPHESMPRPSPDRVLLRSASIRFMTRVVSWGNGPGRKIPASGAPCRRAVSRERRDSDPRRSA